MRYLSLVAGSCSFLIILSLAGPIGCSDEKTQSTERPSGGDKAPGRSSAADRQNQGDTARIDPSDPIESGDTADTSNTPETAESGADVTASSEVPQDPAIKGSYGIKSYTQDLQDGAYASAMIFYPTGLPKNKKVAATTLSGGYSNTKEQMSWIGEHLASHGVVVIAFTPTNNLTTDASVWSRGHIGAFNKVKAESERPESPILGLIDPTKVGLMGFSMGGAGTLMAVDQLKGEAGAAIALCPYQPKAPTAKTPLLYITGTNDRTAAPAAVITSFERTNSGAAKAIKNIEGMGHGDITRTQTYRKELASSMTAWIGLYLIKNSQYRKFLDNKDLKIED